MAKKRRRRKTNRQKHIDNTKRILTCIILSVLVLGLSYIIFKTDILKPSLNEITTSYISFNNKNITDMLKINNINKKSDKLGKSTWNNKSIVLDIDGEKNREYKIIIYPIIKSVDNKYIKVYLKDNKELVNTNLDNLKDSEDGGKIIYQGKINNKKKILRMWIDKEYKGNVNDNSFEIKIK